MDFPIWNASKTHPFISFIFPPFSPHARYSLLHSILHGALTQPGSPSPKLPSLLSNGNHFAWPPKRSSVCSYLLYLILCFCWSFQHTHKFPVSQSRDLEHMLQDGSCSGNNVKCCFQTFSSQPGNLHCKGVSSRWFYVFKTESLHTCLFCPHWPSVSVRSIKHIPSAWDAVFNTC